MRSTSVSTGASMSTTTASGGASSVANWLASRLAGM